MILPREPDEQTIPFCDRLLALPALQGYTRLEIVKHEGIVFRHLLRLILLCGEFAQVCPPETTPTEWQADLRDLSERLTASCREVDPASTDEAIQFAHAADVVEGEAVQKVVQTDGREKRHGSNRVECR